MFVGLDVEEAKSLAMAHTKQLLPSAKLAVRRTHLEGIDWVVTLWTWTDSENSAEEVVVRVRSTDGEIVNGDSDGLPSSYGARRSIAHGRS